MSYIVLTIDVNDVHIVRGGDYDPLNPNDPSKQVLFSTKNGYMFKSPTGEGIVKIPGGKTLDVAVVGSSPVTHYKFGSVTIKIPGDGPNIPNESINFPSPPLTTFADTEKRNLEGVTAPLKPTAVEPPVGSAPTINVGWESGGP